MSADLQTPHGSAVGFSREKPTALPWGLGARRGSLIILWSLLAPAVLLSAASRSRADVSLPLQGYYRPGRFIPVRVSAATTLYGNGVTETRLELSNLIVPVFVQDGARELRGDDGSALSLRAVGPGERLVGFTPLAQAVSSALFTGEKTIGIPLDAANPLPGPAAAWSALDAVVLDADSMMRLDDDRRGILLAAGVVLAAVGESAPDMRWPWKRDGALWMLKYARAGPVDELVDERAFAPTYGWKPDWPPTELRGQVLGAGVLLGIAVAALALWRSKLAVVAIVLLAVLGSLGVVAWRSRLGRVDVGGGDVVVISDDGFVQRDTWLYERAREDGPRRMVWNGWTRPVFASQGQLERAALRVVIDKSGRTVFEYQARRGQTIAFLHCSVQPARGAMTVTSGGRTPMRDLATALYVSPERSVIAVEAPVLPERWAGAVVGTARRKP